MGFRVFLSYATDDIDLVRQARRELEDQAIAVFIAEDDLALGDQIPGTLIDEIKRSDMLVVFWGNAAIRSEWVSQEIGIAEGAEIPILAVLLDGVENAPGFAKTRKHLRIEPSDPDGLAKLTAAIQEKAKRKIQQLTRVLVGLGVVLVIGWIRDNSEDDE